MENLKERYFIKYPDRIEEYENMKERYLQGESLTKICKDSNYIKDRHIFSKLLKSDGISITKCGRKYNYNENAFKEINDEESAYWLGFLYADGNINELRGICDLTMSEKDYTHLLKFRDYVITDKKMELIKRKSHLSTYSKDYYSYRIYITNKTITNNLVDKGCLWNKTFDVKFPSYNIVPKNLMHHFIRGFFDGDGSSYLDTKTKRPQVNFTCANKKFLYDIQNCLIDNKVLYYECKVYNTKSEAYSYQINAIKHVKNFYDYIYKDANIFLKRKKDVFDSYYCRPQSTREKTEDN